jgi:hypothetical protein
MTSKALQERLVVLTLALESAAQQGELSKVHAFIQQRQVVLNQLKGRGPETRATFERVRELDARIGDLLKGRMHQIAERLDGHRRAARARRAYRAG